MKNNDIISEPKGGEPRLYKRISVKNILKSLLVIALTLTLALGFAKPFAAKAEADEPGLGDNDYYIPDDTDPFATEDYRRWAQADPRWGGIRLGTHGRTVAEAGCLVTSITKLIIQSGYRDASDFNVATLVNWLNAHGGLSSEGNLYWQKPAEMIEGFEYEGMDYNCGYSSNSSFQNKVLNLAAQNKHIVLTVKNYGHYVAVDNAKSLEMGCVCIMDSLNNVSGNADIPLTSRYSYVNRLAIYSGNNADDSDYISRCSFMMTHFKATVVSSYASFYTLPCTVNAGEGSETAGRAYQGTELEVTADIINTLYEHWYQVRTEDGEAVYIWGGQVVFNNFINDTEVESSAPPSGTLPVGRWYALTENIVTRHRIETVTGRITDIDSEVICEAQVTPGVHGGYDISGTGIDAGIAFGSLEEGHYLYQLLIEVEAESNITNESKQFVCIFTSPFSIGIDALPVYTVVYLDPLNEEVLAEELIAEGFFPIEPPAPEHEDRVFVRWSEDGRIYGDTVITAIYEGDELLTDPFIPGDADGDGMITLMDAVKILRYAMGETDEVLNPAAADYDGNGIVSAADALHVMRIVMNITD